MESGNGKRKREWKRGARIERGSGIELRVGGNERGGWKGMLDIFTPRRLRGGGKNSRRRIFGGWRSAANHWRLATPRDRFALAPPPQAAEGMSLEGEFFCWRSFGLRLARL